MNIFSSFNIATRSLRSNRTRTILTIVGVVIGIASVMIILSAGQAIKQFMIDEVTAFGSNIIQVEIKIPSTDQASAENAFGQAQGITITTLTHDDALAVTELENINQVYSAVLGQEVTSYEQENAITTLFGTTADFIAIDASEVQVGRFFEIEEDRTLAQVVVLGAGVKEKLFGDQDAIGKKVRIGRLKYEVIGVLASRGASFAFDMDDMAIVPLRTLQKKIMGISHISYFIATMHNPVRDLETKADIEAILRSRHDIADAKRDDFAVTTQAEMQDLLNTIIGGVQLLLIAVASISLVVGGVGIMNIMYVSVSQRRYEIGLRKSMGATERNILWQFLWEAITVTGLGGLLGVVIGVFVSFVITVVAQYLGYELLFTLPWWSFVIAVGFSVTVGLIFGLYPARTAARLHPIAALRKT